MRHHRHPRRCRSKLYVEQSHHFNDSIRPQQEFGDCATFCVVHNCKCLELRLLLVIRPLKRISSASAPNAMNVNIDAL